MRARMRQNQVVHIPKRARGRIVVQTDDELQSFVQRARAIHSHFACARATFFERLNGDATAKFINKRRAPTDVFGWRPRALSAIDRMRALKRATSFVQLFRLLAIFYNAAARAARVVFLV